MKLQHYEQYHGKHHHHKGKKSHKIMKKMAKLEKKLGKYNLDANLSDSSSSSSSAGDCRRHRRRTRSRSRGQRRGHPHKHGKRSSSSDSTSSSSTSSSSSRSPSPGHRRRPHHLHHHGPPHLVRSRSFGGRPSGPPFPWGPHHSHPLQHLHPHGPPHHRGRFGRRHRHHDRGVPGCFAFHQRQDVPANDCCEETQPDLVDLSANGEEEVAASNVEEMEEDVQANGENGSQEQSEEEPERGPELDENLAKKWTEILQKGLPDEQRTAFIRKYPVSLNCLLLQAPKINKEILAIAPDSAIHRDSIQMQEQNQIGAGLTTLGRALSDLKSKIAKDRDLAEVYDTLNEAAEVIVDAHHNMTQTRQASLSAELHRRIRPFVENCVPDSLLFGKNFGEKVKNVKGFRKGRKDQRPEYRGKKGDKCRGNGDKRKSKGKGCGACPRGLEQHQ